MSVKRIRTSHRTDGTVAVTMEFTPAAWAVLARMAANGSHPDVADYLAAVANMLVIEADPESAPYDDDADLHGDGIPF